MSGPPPPRPPLSAQQMQQNYHENMQRLQMGLVPGLNPHQQNTPAPGTSWVQQPNSMGMQAQAPQQAQFYGQHDPFPGSGSMNPPQPGLLPIPPPLNSPVMPLPQTQHPYTQHVAANQAPTHTHSNFPPPGFPPGSSPFPAPGPHMFPGMPGFPAPPPPPGVPVSTFGVYNDPRNQYPPQVPPPPPEPERPPEPPSPARDLLRNPGRSKRPQKMVFVMRGLPGCGKSHQAQVIKAIELEHGAPAPRILSIDDYFLTETEKHEPDPETGKKRKVRVMDYEYDDAMLPAYRASLHKAYAKCIMEGHHPFVIIDDVNAKVADFAEYRRLAVLNGFAFYLVEIDADVEKCVRQNVHHRTADEIRALKAAWETAPYMFDRLHCKGLEQKDEDIETVDMTEEVKAGPKETTASRWEEDEGEHTEEKDETRKRTRKSPEQDDRSSSDAEEKPTKPTKRGKNSSKPASPFSPQVERSATPPVQSKDSPSHSPANQKSSSPHPPANGKASATAKVALPSSRLALVADYGESESDSE